MKLTHRLALFLVTGNCVVLGLYGWLAWRREAEMFERAIEHETRAAGATLLAAIEAAWIRHGADGARPLIEAIDDTHHGMTLRWSTLADVETRRPPADLARLRAGEPVFERSGGALHTLVAFDPPGDEPPLVLEVSESLAAGERYLRSSVYRLAAATLLSVVVSGLLAAALGAALVGRPVTALVAQVERIGGGERSQPTQRHRKDELGRLARAIDRMSHDLAAARETAAREANERLTTLRQLRHAERLATVGRLSSGIAHELGTPLNVLLARSKMIEKTEGVAEDVARHARIIREQSQRMTRIIRQLLDFARRGDSRKEATDLRALATRTAEVLRPLAEKRAVSISLADDGAAPATASVDPGQIEQVLTNLVINAIQASPEGGEVRISIDAVRAAPPPSHGRATGPYWRLSVRDSGPGIPPEIRDRIFEPFFTTKDVGEGTGLGLPVAHGIVAEHEGWIEVGEGNGAGAELAIHLPREEAAA